MARFNGGEKRVNPFQAGVNGKVDMPTKPSKVIHIGNLSRTEAKKISPPENNIARPQAMPASGWDRKVDASTTAPKPDIQ